MCTYSAGSQTCIQLKQIWKNQVCGTPQSTLSCHKSRNFFHFPLQSKPLFQILNHQVKGKARSPTVRQHTSWRKSSPSCPFAFKPQHLHQSLQTKATIQAVEFRHYTPRIIPSLCSSDCAAYALLICSNKATLLFAVRLLVTRHWKQFFLLCELTWVCKKYRLTRRKPIQRSHRPLMPSSFFLCCITPHQ